MDWLLIALQIPPDENAVFKKGKAVNIVDYPRNYILDQNAVYLKSYLVISK